ncbi:hypothetical protein BCEN4_1230037 [Burkholderia cenocepacia]|nr:hypothetical protein BCEN4_1230037 [Burkholderia cenocepacia]
MVNENLSIPFVCLRSRRSQGNDFNSVKRHRNSIAFLFSKPLPHNLKRETRKIYCIRAY